MAKRVAITIAGAVSLGSYEAGVTYELLEAFRAYNEGVDAGKIAGEKIYVDVLTGASAGGMTAAMLAQRLMFDGASMEGEFTNPLYYAWVERIDIRELVRLKPKEGVWHSLLSSDLIEDIGKQMLEDSMDPAKPLSGPHAVVELDQDQVALPISLGLALTNLTGVDYMLGVAGNPDDGFNYTTSVDQLLFPEVKPTDRNNSGMWAKLRHAAVVCGAFPAAFRPQELKRDWKDYGPPLPSKPVKPEPGKTYVDWGTMTDPAPFVYADGGILQNQPLGIAKNFVDKRVEKASLSGGADAYRLADDRLYTLISPNAVKSTVSKNLVADSTTIARELVELFHTYLRQASFHDWIVAEGMNTQIHLLDTRASQLAGKIIDGSVAAGPLDTVARELNSLLLETDATQIINRLRAQYAIEYADVLKAKGVQVAETFLGAIATLESAAQLGNRDVMKIVAVIADGRTELAGSGISAFAGFFSSEFRKHDYWVGRVKTRVYLQRSDVKGILGVTEWPDEAAWGGKCRAYVTGGECQACTKGLACEARVREVLKNPTKIDKLPLPLGEMMRPGIKSLFCMIYIRRALLWAILTFLVLILFSFGALACVIHFLLSHLHR
jgi:hypothetical protein